MSIIHAKSSEQTLVQKLDSEYNDFKLYKCPVAWGILWGESQTFRSTTGSPDLIHYPGGQRRDAYNSIVPF